MIEHLKANSYPGRGILIGKSEDGKNAVIGYFIMGRSVNSRNRLFVEADGGIRTEAIDPSKMADPSLIIYAPVRLFENHLIVTNGDQTDTIYDFLKDGKCFQRALKTREFEPDFPNFTPRISGLVSFKDNAFSFKLSILKAGANKSCNRYFFNYDDEDAGFGRLIHTYKADGDPIPSFEGEPVKVPVKGDIDTFSKELWDSLDNQNKVSLFVRYVNLETGESKTKMLQKAFND